MYCRLPKNLHSPISNEYSLRCIDNPASTPGIVFRRYCPVWRPKLWSEVGYVLSAMRVGQSSGIVCWNDDPLLRPEESRQTRTLGIPQVLFCLDCGFSRFTVPETELALVRIGSTIDPSIEGRR